MTPNPNTSGTHQSPRAPRPSRVLGVRRAPQHGPVDDQINNNSAPGSSIKGFLVETLKIVILAALIVAPIKFFIFQPYYVKGESMEPTFLDSEYLIVDKLSYRFGDPERGDVIVFRYPRDRTQFFIKRIVALPGEEVRVAGGTVSVALSNIHDAITLTESYLPQGEFTDGSETVTLGPDEYFVLGDNRDSSLDSRRIGPVSREDIIGRTWFRAWPLDRVGTFPHPVYNIAGE